MKMNFDDKFFAGFPMTPFFVYAFSIAMEQK